MSTLFPHQIAGVAFLKSRKCALLADEMGLGKTAQAICAAIDGGDPVVVVCPAVAKGVWRREFATWASTYTVTTIVGRGGFRWPTRGEVVIVNYDILSDELTQPPVGVRLVCDEAHAVKQSKALRTRKVRLLVAAVLKFAGSVWALTATPLLGRPQDLWGVLASFKLSKLAFGDYAGFLAAFGGYPGEYGVVFDPRRSDPATIQAAMARVMMRREKSSVLNLPAKIYETRTVELTTRDLASLRATETEQKAIDSLGSIETIEQLESAPIRFDTLSRLRKIVATLKIPAMLAELDTVAESDVKMVVFSAHRGPIDALADRAGWAVITGDTPPAERAKIQDQFQRGELSGVGATIQAGGTAITLTAATRVLFVDRDWTPALNAQAEDRLHRIGQTQTVNVINLVADCSLDRAIANVLEIKRPLIAGAIVEVAEPTPVVEVTQCPADLTQSPPGLAEPSTWVGSWTKLDGAWMVRPTYQPGCRGPVEGDPIVVRKRDGDEQQGTVGAVHGAYVTLRRPPSQISDRVRQWASNGILAILANQDDDEVSSEATLRQNGRGFMSAWASAGTSLAQAIRRGDALSDKQWATVIRICKAHNRQVGAM